MSVVLHLGVVDVAYSDASGSGAKTTGDVAALLEERYHIMSTFFALRRFTIASLFADNMAASIKRLARTGERIDTRASLTYGADQKIETSFRRFIFDGEMDTLNFALTGQDRLTAAAAAGVNHRRKHPYAKKNKPRPSFVDTGLYVQSFRAWTSVSAAPAEVS
jgi:hypothetical protein